MNLCTGRKFGTDVAKRYGEGSEIAWFPGKRGRKQYRKWKTTAVAKCYRFKRCMLFSTEGLFGKCLAGKSSNSISSCDWGSVNLQGEGVSGPKAKKSPKKSRKSDWSQKSEKSLEKGPQSQTKKVWQNVFFLLFGPFLRLFSDLGLDPRFRDLFRAFWRLGTRLLVPSPRNLNHRSKIQPYHTTVCPHSSFDSPGAQTLGFAALEPFLAANFSVNSANTLLCDAFALSQRSTRENTRKLKSSFERVFLDNFSWVPDSRHREEGKSSRELLEKIHVNAVFSFGISGFWVGFGLYQLDPKVCHKHSEDNKNLGGF